MASVNNIVISCIDFRFRNKISKKIEETLKGEADLVSLAGASKSLIDPKSQEVVLTQLQIANDLHHIKTVHILDHMDCGAYGGSAKFKSQEEETAMHEEKLREAAGIIKDKFPQLETKLYIVGFDSILEVLP